VADQWQVKIRHELQPLIPRVLIVNLEEALVRRQMPLLLRALMLLIRNVLIYSLLPQHMRKSSTPVCPIPLKSSSTDQILQGREMDDAYPRK
jgi:hypothetical protein